MRELKATKPDYGNWVSMRLIYFPGAVGILFLVLSLLVPVLIVGAVLFIAVSAYFAYARHQFSPRGGKVKPASKHWF